MTTAIVIMPEETAPAGDREAAELPSSLDLDLSQPPDSARDPIRPVPETKPAQQPTRDGRKVRKLRFPRPTVREKRQRCFSGRYAKAFRHFLRVLHFGDYKVTYIVTHHILLAILQAMVITLYYSSVMLKYLKIISAAGLFLTLLMCGVHALKERLYSDKKYGTSLVVTYSLGVFAFFAVQIAAISLFSMESHGWHPYIVSVWTILLALCTESAEILHRLIHLVFLTGEYTIRTIFCLTAVPIYRKKQGFRIYEAEYETHEITLKESAMPVSGYCTMCMEEYQPEDVVVTLPCRGMHLLHRDCFTKLVCGSDYCPICSQPPTQMQDH